MKELFVARRFNETSQEMIDEANSIIIEYQRQGFTLTLRQLYYQFVARGLLANKQTEYRRLGSVVNDARLAGVMDWSAIEDRTRSLHKSATWHSPSEILMSAAEGYDEDAWVTQPLRMEVWIEKDALIGVIENVCYEHRLPYFACRGYASQSELYAAGKRFLRNALNHGQRTTVLHFGDHDPSGIDMTRDNKNRLRMFSERNCDIIRMALNMDQISEYDPPPNPAKLTDSRSAEYVAAYGDDSWELDALEPRVIADLIRNAVAANIDKEAWEEAQAQIEEKRERLRTVAKEWKD